MTRYGQNRVLLMSSPNGDQFGIQFAQIGDDKDATASLLALDEGIAAFNAIRVSI